MMDKKNKDLTRDQKIDAIIEKHRTLDGICREIFLTLWAYKRLRFNELHRYIKKFGTDISKQSLLDHLGHLKKQKLISRREEFQNVSYGFTDEIDSLLTAPQEEIRKWLEYDETLPKRFRPVQFDEKQYYDKLPEKQLDETIDKDIRRVLTQNLFELKTFVNYDLKLDRPETDATFWNFAGNPIYRIEEKSIVKKCRSEKYRERFFEKIDALINETRPDKELFREREERKRKHGT